MIKKILLSLFLLIISLYFVNADIRDYTIYYGTITLNDGTTTSNVEAGQTVSATIGGVASGSQTITTLGEYKLIVTCTLSTLSCDDAAITFSLSTPSGYDSVSDSTPSAATYNRANNGKYVSLNLAFTGTPTAAAEEPPEAAAGDGGSAMAAPSAPTPETLTKITDLTTVEDIIASLPEGWTNVDVYQVGTPTTDAVTETITKGIENALIHASDTKAISALQTVQNKLEAGEVKKVNVIKTLDAYKVTNKDTGQSIYRGKITITFTAPNDLINVKIIEVVPSSVVDSIEGIDFPGIKPEVLQTNPIFQWTFDSVKKDETKTLDYIIKKKVDKIETKTVVTSEEKVKKPIITKSVMGIMIIVIIILVGLVIYYQYIKKKEGKGKGVKKKKR